MVKANRLTELLSDHFLEIVNGVQAHLDDMSNNIDEIERMSFERNRARETADLVLTSRQTVENLRRQSLDRVAERKADFVRLSAVIEERLSLMNQGRPSLMPSVPLEPVYNSEPSETETLTNLTNTTGEPVCSVSKSQIPSSTARVRRNVKEKNYTGLDADISPAPKTRGKTKKVVQRKPSTRSLIKKEAFNNSFSTKNVLTKLN